MAFKFNENGTINSLPLWSWETGVYADAALVMQIELALDADKLAPQTRTVQMTASSEQLELLIRDLQTIAAKIREAQGAVRH